ncbi:MAG: L-aspartate oxidase [Clostridium sp.]|uniref:L-aspartate oxidase n=1 Tax=Clostridium sp. DSM 8431 TaxID=1761781 RepID=UPI0008E44F8B|nr:L-aspartate oxidase [Clostridium sp. DSM 8431]MCR4943982.1 L-aspartate oxidase [Clostridium sp.]SFU38242.1 L-aspartate oxidase [Clostridium sp. DSM 8431]
MNKTCDVLIAGSGIAGVYTALNLDKNLNVIIVTKEGLKDCNSFLAQGGISTLLNDDDVNSYIEDTLKAGNFKNDEKAVEVLVKESRENIKRLVKLNVKFDRNEDGTLSYTREGGHSTFRIAHIKDETGRFIMESLYAELAKRNNIKVIENCKLIDIIKNDNECLGGLCTLDNKTFQIHSKAVILATGGLGGLFSSTTNFPCLTGDGISIALKNNIAIKDINYLQLHPTVLYEEKSNGKRLLLSESLRGEGGIIRNLKGEEFVDSLKPRDVVSRAILKEMAKNPSVPYVYLDLTHLGKEFLIKRFPFLYDECLKRGYKMEKDMLPISPAHHYAMGGIKVNTFGETNLKSLYALGETACTGVHGSNRLASNSLLEGVVFGYRCAQKINNELYNDITSYPSKDELIDFLKERVDENYVKLLNC